jgi:phosphomethylpyrimidine synthase
MTILTKNTALAGRPEQGVAQLSVYEHLSPHAITQAIEAGHMVLLGNPAHAGVTPTLIGQPARIKVNANIGTSPLIRDETAEMAKLKASQEAGADTVMDLSTAGDLSAIRERMLDATSMPLGTVPLYALAQKYIDAEKDPAGFTETEMLEEIERQAEQGVDFITVHCGLTKRGAEYASGSNRLLGIVSRGGSIIARWMRQSGKENPFLTRYDDIVKICVKHNVTLSLGDGLRPGANADAGDAAQFEEVVTLGELQVRALAAGAQAMIEGPGHVALHQVQAQIQAIKTITNNAPLYVLGPLTTDAAPGYDHIAGAIGGAQAAYFGADFLCYLTPAEHLTLPDEDDVRQGVMASRIAAASAEASLGRPWAVARDTAVSEGRRDLDWQKIADNALDPCAVAKRRAEHAGEKECAMCGKFCAIRMADDAAL